MKILITGGLGFLGTHLADFLCKDHEIGILDSMTYAHNPRLLTDNRISFIVKDGINSDRLWDAVAWSDLVLHWAAESSVDRSSKWAMDFVNTNIVGTQEVIDACVSLNRLLIHKSTDEVLGSLPYESSYPINEDGIRYYEYWEDNSPINPHNVYASTKAAGELLVKAAINVHGLKAKIVRSCNVYGPGQHIEKMIPKSIKLALSNEPIELYPEGDQSRQWVYISDYINAIDMIIKKGEWGETYNIHAGPPITNRELVNEILKQIHKPLTSYFQDWVDSGRVVFKDLRPGHDQRYEMVSSSIFNIGWMYNTDFSEGIYQTIESYR